MEKWAIRLQVSHAAGSLEGVFSSLRKKHLVVVYLHLVVYSHNVLSFSINSKNITHQTLEHKSEGEAEQCKLTLLPAPSFIPTLNMIRLEIRRVNELWAGSSGGSGVGRRESDLNSQSVKPTHSACIAL